MLQLGKTQPFSVLGKDHGRVRLENGGEEILLAEGEGAELKPGDEIRAFVYHDKKNLVATLKTPLIEVGQVKKLKVISKTKIGAFVDIGLPKDVLFPFGEQRERIHEGGTYLFTLREDRSRRLAVSMDIKEHLRTDSPYQRGQQVEGTIYHHKRGLGLLIAVDDAFDALVPEKEIVGVHEVGDTIHGRVIHVLEDGKLTVTMRDTLVHRIDKDAEGLYRKIRQHKGRLPVGNKSHPDTIYDLTRLSKKAFKRAVGRLYREGVIVPYDDAIVLKRESSENHKAPRKDKPFSKETRGPKKKPYSREKSAKSREVGGEKRPQRQKRFWKKSEGPKRHG